MILREIHLVRGLKVQTWAHKKHLFHDRDGEVLDMWLEGGCVYVQRREVRPEDENGTVVIPVEHCDTLVPMYEPMPPIPPKSLPRRRPADEA